MGVTRRARARVAWALSVIALPSMVAVTSHHAAAAPTAPPAQDTPAATPSDDLPNPLEEKRRELRETALEQVLSGEADVEQRGASTVVKVSETAAPSQGNLDSPRANGTNGGGEDQYVELSREKTDKIFVILAEFGNERHPNYPDQDTDPDTPGPARFDGPLHNQIPEPDRRVDNSTVWQADYSADHYRDLYFGTDTDPESVKTYYEYQSSGRYSVDGQVSDWVKVRYNEARYGRSNGYPCDSIVCSNTWALIRDAIDAWVAQQHAAGRTDAQIATDLASYDVWDRYDYDGDGDFNEPDGYIDHFQIVHAGGDQADGDPWQGEDAIWSHRWYAFLPNPANPSGPPDNQLGGTPIGTTGLWVGDYTIQPENGGMDVFAHEFGHDLGLPDLYDTAAGPSPVEWWSIMAQSRVSAPGEGLGTRAADLGPWEKLTLGWLDYEIVVAGQTRTLELGPHEYNSDKAQAVVVVLPRKEVVTDLGDPFAGTKQWWSGEGDDLTTTMTKSSIALPGTATLTFQTHWNIEDCGADACDYAYVEVDDGSGWIPIAGDITNPDEHNGIDGLQEDWTAATFDLSAYAGKTIGLRFRYATDGAVQGTDEDQVAGLFVDDVAITAGSTVLFSDGAENDAGGWVFASTDDVGFHAVGASETNDYDNYYIASNREYISFDQYLKTGPYNFGWATTKPDYVEHFPYQDGLLIWYWDTSFSDNNVSVHPGQGEILVIDSHPRAIFRLDGQPWRSRIQLYDAPFGLQKADSFTLHFNGRASYLRGQNAEPLFDDSRVYFDEDMPTGGVDVPDTNTRIRVLSEHGTSVRIRIGVG